MKHVALLLGCCLSLSGVGCGGASQGNHDAGASTATGGNSEPIATNATAGTNGAAGSTSAGASGAAASGSNAGSNGNGTAGRSGTAGAMGAAASGGMGSGPLDAGTAGAAGAAGTDGTAGTGDSGASQGDRCTEAVAGASPPTALMLSGNLGAHDPSAIEASGLYYVYATGRGIPTKTSSDLMSWKAGSNVFAANPSWIAQQVSGATDIWAPDISSFGGTYHLYYAVSTFGSNKSCIGHATKAALDSTVEWADHGSVVCSNAGSAKDDWNAIDPNVALDTAGTPWLVFGRFWGGIKLVQLTSTGERADTMLYSLAARPSAGGAIEGPYIVHRCGYYYLFASFDKCCDGVNSTYKVAVGRSTQITGPYVDKAGTAMMSGGGTIIVQGNSRWIGPGHNAVLFTHGKAYNIYHALDANANAAATLRVSELVWDSDAWPISGGP